MPRGVMCRNGNEKKIRPCKSARNAGGIQRIKVFWAMRKNIVNPISARYLFSSPKKVIHSRWSISVIVVTAVIAVSIGDEKRRKARICFGIPFSPKNHRLNRNYCRERSLFFSLPDSVVYQCYTLSSLTSHSVPTHYNHYTGYNGKSLYPVQ